jgi:hypothetical protein
MASLGSFNLKGQTTAGTDGTATGIIATQLVSIDSDGFLRWTDATGKSHALPISGELSALLKVLLTGTDGLTAKLFT